MNKPTIESIKMYEAATKWVSSEDFEVTRVKTDTADGVPFNLLGNDYLYRVVERYEEGQVIEYSVDLTDSEMESLVTRALMFHAPWPCRRGGEYAKPGQAHFIETDWPRERKWNPDCPPMLIPHFNILCEDLEGFEEGDNPEWEIMDAWLEQHREKKIAEQKMPDWKDYLVPSNAAPF